MQIATRVLTLRSKDKDVPIAIRIHAPYQSLSNRWSCRYEIDWPGEPWTHEAHGIDSIQALVLALSMIGAEIYTSDYHKAGRLSLDKRGGGYGFPVPNNIRDLLEGDDAKFF